MPKTQSNRISEIDFLRGIAIIMMIIFHFMWDLTYFNLSNADLYSSMGFWGIFQKITGSLFIFIVGISLTLSYWRTAEYKGVYPKKFLLRGARIFGLGLIITSFSYIFMPDSFVFFGILHFIGIAIIIATPFIRFTLFNLLLSIASLLLSFYINNTTLGFPWLVWLGFNYPVSTLDIYQVFPWLFLVFLGMFIGN
ncbi:MAG: heparan-alpha-glucosaminide N-acetyltransferase, partial [Candidatus Woesearchaeota archaeon]|nr:heparan-alpha-glucosaminide N-acetyltransferase [Candidatus Woesearchaeota archaeon]